MALRVSQGGGYTCLLGHYTILLFAVVIDKSLIVAATASVSVLGCSGCPWMIIYRLTLWKSLGI